jgi:hypothetical protein
MHMIQQDTALYLGPAGVVRTLARRALVRLPDGAERWADLALAFPYQPAADDLVLVAAQEDRAYVVGVLRGSGPATFAFPGDVTIASTDGRVRLRSAHGVEVEAPEVAIRGDEVGVEARTFRQRLECAYQWVKDLVQLRAGRQRTVVDGSIHQTAERTLIRSERETKVDGEQVLLG